jgi:chromosome segregation ATPase
LQENRLATLGRQYQEARTRALDARMAQTHLEQQLRQLSERVNSVSNHDERLGVEHRIGQLKSEIAQQAVKTGQLQTDEADAAHMLSTEQQRWSDFNQRLETVERTLEKSGAGR